MSRRKDWCFTLNNPDEDPLIFMERIKEINEVEYCVFQLEKGENGTNHYQGFIQLKHNQRMSFLKNKISRRAHWEPRKGSQDEARDYCMKEDSRLEGPWEYGIFHNPQRGQRTDLLRIRAMVKEGKPLHEIVDLCDNYQQIRFAEKLYSYKQPSTEYIVKEVYWYWGPTGTGKTREAVDRCPKDNIYICRQSRWMDGYWGQSHVIFDDLRAKNFPYVDMLNLLDGYEERREIKGSHTLFRPKVVYVTAPLPPEKTYPMTFEKNEGGIDQLLRRITEIKEFFEKSHRGAYYNEQNEMCYSPERDE